MWLPDGISLVGDALRVAKLGHANSLVREMKTYLIVVLHLVLDLNSHADALVIPSLVIGTADIVIELFLCFKVIWFVKRHC